MAILTEQEKDERATLVEKYNKARSPQGKHSAYENIMAFEDRMLTIGHNG